jgi:hypothetical protein
VLAASIDIVGVVSERLRVNVVSIAAAHVERRLVFELSELGARRASNAREGDDHGRRFEPFRKEHRDNVCACHRLFKLAITPRRSPT